MTASSRILPAVPWVLALLLAVLPGAGWAAPAAPAPEKPAAKQPAKSGAKPQPEVLVGEEEGEEDEDGMPGKREERYERIIEMLLYHDPNDSSGHAAYSWAIRACEEGRYDEGMQQLRLFALKYPRNLYVNEALETVLLIRGNREFKDEPLRLYFAADAARRAGRLDSAAVLAKQGLARYPGAKIRDHWSYMLAELARDRGDHAAALGFALAVADTASKSRLAPYALKLAAEETLAVGREPSRALRYYQDLLERYPESAVAPEARARALELRKKLQL